MGSFAMRLLVLLILCLIPSALFPLWCCSELTPTVLVFAARQSWGGSYGKVKALAMFGRTRGTRETAPTVTLARDEKCGSRACAVQPHLLQRSLLLCHPCVDALALRNVGRTEAAKSPARWEAMAPIHVEEHVLS
ncbi:hypothetical protein BDP55DRAFT_144674 [Colletotrichum godetiae]|uniref:Secreted protein n=1 Tax=Colletotrichum godetiae TaxID=1209918 RepID=A0AAJ0B1B0_9PEZI|nr:uncharacterized protein BDP55DRAFT_144674 [Colletotrichum godetiae]KAK1700789.1 hypothetical protein BDP55DRAFT_144674 [Colletotrichum godetiae]